MPFKDPIKQIEYRKNWYLKNKKLVILRSKNWAINNSEKRKRISKKWLKKNKERIYPIIKKWKKNNKEHIKQTNKEWYKKNLAKIKIKRSSKESLSYFREYYRKNAKRLRAEQKIRRQKRPEHYREVARKSSKKFRYKKYGISVEDFNLMSKVQSSLCKICKEKKKLYVDHCHKTNRVRGLLCHTCNVGIGLLKDNIVFLKSAIQYLK